MNFEKYLKQSEYIDYSNPNIQNLAKQLAKNCKNDEQIAKNCFLYVRDEIKHSGDVKAKITTIKASEVLEYKTGWCYTKAFLLAALLRANNIPTALCYQRLSCGEYKDDIFCLHGLNAVYLKEYGWYKLDPRGNKEGVKAEFNPPLEQLAFNLEENEFTLASLYDKPLDEVIKSLEKYKNYDEIIDNFPIIDEFISAVSLKDAKDLSKISTSLLKYIFEEKNYDWFKKFFTVEEFIQRIKSEKFKHYAYVVDNKIVGYIAIKNQNHLYHLFVDENYHGKGIAKSLWQFINENLEFDSMSTNASLFAIDVYESFGFVKEGEIKVEDELKYQPMVFKKS